MFSNVDRLIEVASVTIFNSIIQNNTEAMGNFKLVSILKL
jgi:hypothetical protein